jgi:hypothetical protein
MPAIRTISGETLLIQVGAGAATANTTRSVTWSVATEADPLVDTADLSAVAQTQRRASQSDIKIDGAGIIPAGDQKLWIDWASNGAVRHVKVTQSNTGANGGWYQYVPVILTQLQFTGERAKSVTAQITLEQAGWANGATSNT